MKCVRDFKTHVNQKFVEFYDSRACVAAYDQLLNTQFKNGTIDLRFVWDYPARLRKAGSSNSSPSQMPMNIERRQADHYEPPQDFLPLPRRNDERDPRRNSVQPKSRKSDDGPDSRLVQAQKAQQMLALAASSFSSSSVIESKSVSNSESPEDKQSNNNTILTQMNQLLSLLQQKKAE